MSLGSDRESPQNRIQDQFWASPAVSQVPRRQRLRASASVWKPRPI